MVQIWKRDRFHEHLGLYAVMAILLPIRLGALSINGTDLFYDEAQYWVWSRELDFGYYSKPGMIAWIIRGATEICGNGEACIRAPSAIFHAATAIILCKLGSVLYDRKIGALAGIFYLLLPAVSLSSTLISTDVPLLFFWSIALYGICRFNETNSWRHAVMLGCACALGLNAKYAMIFLPICILLYAAITHNKRWMFFSPKLWVAGGLTTLGFLPNFIWNIKNNYVTFSHTRDNGRWDGTLFHFDNMVEFFGAQFGVLGPALFLCLIFAVATGIRSSSPNQDRLLLFCCIPIIAGITLQAFLSRAHANWGATAYPAATIFLAAIIIQCRWRLAHRITISLHGMAALVIAFGPVAVSLLPQNHKLNPYRSITGWEMFSKEVESIAAKHDLNTLILANRSHAAAAHYYLRDEPKLTIKHMAQNDQPTDHFQLKFAWEGSTPALLILYKGSNPAAYTDKPVKNIEDITVTRAVSKSLAVTAWKID